MRRSWKCIVNTSIVTILATLSTGSQRRTQARKWWRIHAWEGCHGTPLHRITWFVELQCSGRNHSWCIFTKAQCLFCAKSRLCHSRFPAQLHIYERLRMRKVQIECAWTPSLHLTWLCDKYFMKAREKSNAVNVVKSCKKGFSLWWRLVG
jgi:hypothetical protein